jgi:hypothetical protein
VDAGLFDFIPAHVWYFQALLNRFFKIQNVTFNDVQSSRALVFLTMR